MSDQTTRDTVAQEASAEVAVADGEAAVERRCETCRAWAGPGVGDYEPAYGECRRRCPSVVTEEPGVTGVQWPVVCRADWCLDWLPQEAPR